MSQPSRNHPHRPFLNPRSAHGHSTRPDPSTMRPVPSLDVIAGRASHGSSSPASTSSLPRGQALAPPIVTATASSDDVRDSRSSSSTNSPVPADNEESDFFLAANDSQSSLGVVPNLQDMQVNDQECLAMAETLPSEILISIFSRLSQPKDLLRALLVCKRWARNVVEILWHRPTCTTWDKHGVICRTLGLERPFFAYPEFIRRLNLAALAADVNDGSVMALSVCNRIERLTLTNCKNLTDVGLIALVQNSHHLLALDISGDENITEASINTIAEHCRRLQGLNVSGCKHISNESMVHLAQSCNYLKRLKLNECEQLNDTAVLAFAQNCPNILEIDLHQCRNIGNEPVTALLGNGRALRELRLANCELIEDSAFLTLPSNRIYEHLRILDLTSCQRLTDRAVEKIIEVAPRLRNLVLAKCANITNAAVYAISKLGKNLHYVHLGHCRNITDDAVRKLVSSCNRIRYIDLGCCSHLTDDSVTRLATLPKLKRIGLVKCANITDASMDALARANHRSRQRRDQHGNAIPGEQYHSSSLERVHLSYCTLLTLQSIIKLLNCCPKLTHLSLTGVPAFLREDLAPFCRDAPADFTEHQRNVFCVFSGQGVASLRRYLNTKEEFADLHERGTLPRRRAITPQDIVGVPPIPAQGSDLYFDEPDVVEDDDMGEGSDLALDNNFDIPINHGHAAPPPPPPPPPALGLNTALPHSHPLVLPMSPVGPDDVMHGASLDTPMAAGPGVIDAFIPPANPTSHPPQPSLESTLATPGPSTAGASFAGLDNQTGASTANLHARIEDADETGGT